MQRARMGSPHASLARFLTSAAAAHVRPGTPYSAATTSRGPVSIRWRTVQSSSRPATNARVTIANVRRFSATSSVFCVCEMTIANRRAAVAPSFALCAARAADSRDWEHSDGSTRWDHNIYRDVCDSDGQRLTACSDHDRAPCTDDLVVPHQSVIA